MKTDKLVMKAAKLQECGKTAEAEAIYRKILKENPANFVSCYSLGVIAFTRKDYPAALDLFEVAKKANSGFAPLWYNIGITLGQLARYQEAIANLEQAMKIDPANEAAKKQRDSIVRLLIQNSDVTTTVIANDYQVKITRAVELQNQNRLDEAEGMFLEILADNTADLVSLYSLGVLEQTRKNPNKALAYFERGLAAKPDYAPLWYNIGVVLQSLKQHDKAVESYDKALALNPAYIEAMINRGAVLVEMKRHKDALVNYEELLKVDPNNDKALCNRGIILTDFKLYDHAIQTFERLLQISPEYDYALGLLSFAKLHACSWDNLQKYNSMIFEGIRSGKRVCKSQALLAMSNEPLDHLLCARIFANHYYPPQEAMWQGEIYEHKKIRVAYVSPDFREHPVGHLTAGIFENHDKDKFETIAISLGIDDNSRLRERMLAAFDQFIDVRQMSSRDVAAMMRSMEVDIAVDLGGYTADTRTDIFAYRPAPVQVNYLGYSSTMGVDYIDYIIADRHVIPEDTQDCYSEKVVYMPDTYLPTDSSVNIAEQNPSREEYGLPSSGFVFCSFNHDYKINPGIFDVWMRLLRQVTGSVLWLMKLNESAEQNLQKEAEARGIDSSRIIFATRVPRIEDHLARYRLADLFLDTTPYNAHTTTSDVLRAGLPVLTCMGKAFAGRVAGSLLKTVDLEDLITNSLDEYENLAQRLAQDSGMLENIKNRLKDNLSNSPLYDTRRYCRNLESAFSGMYQRYQSGKTPESFSVEEKQRERILDVNIFSAQATKKTKYTVAILIPVYQEQLNEQEQFSIDYLVKNITRRKLFFIAPESLDKTYYVNRYAGIEFKEFRDINFESIVGYNHLLLDTDFYKSFASYDYMLIHQTDALMFHDNLDYWMERQFDYIGAPWPNGVEVNLKVGKFSSGNGVNLKSYVGNGGFSMRSINNTIALLNEFEEIKDYWIKCGSSEDLFFAFMGMVSDKFTIPNQIIASRFSLELEPEKYFNMNDEEVPTGCHAWWKHDLEFWKKIIAQVG